MKYLEGLVEISGACYYNMIRSAIETLPRETTGNLIGKNKKRNYSMINAYPIQTAERKPSQVAYGNNAAITRLRNLDSLLNKLKGLGFRTIGSYHSHPYEKDKIVHKTLTKGDVNFIADEMKESRRNFWIEIILYIKEKDYSRKKPIGENSTEYKRRIRTILRDSKYHGYDIILSAYLIQKIKNKDKSRVRELKIRKRKIKVRKT